MSDWSPFVMHAPAAAPRSGVVAGVRFAYDDVNRAIDQIFDLRAKVIRVGLLGTLLYRPDPARTIPAKERQGQLDLLEDQVSHFAAITALLAQGQPHPDMDVHMCNWIHACASEKPDKVRVLVRINRLSTQILKAAAGGLPEQSQLLMDHMREARAGLQDAITTLCAHMWLDFERDRSAQLLQAKTSATALEKRLTRLERIGTHVRLVSLNASVESARIGEEGRGLSVIAHEFKGLAEEIQGLAQLARKDVAGMQVDG